MANNTFTINGSATLVLDATRAVGNMAKTVTLVGSNAGFKSANITASGWTGLDTSSLSDLRYSWFYNNDLTASIVIASGSNGEHVVTMLYPGDTAVMPWSASLPQLYAKAFGVTTNQVVVQYILVES